MSVNHSIATCKPVKNAIADVFADARARGRKALIPFLTAGYPSVDLSVQLALSAIDAGADILEIGAPFSDPLADGPAIQHSSERALAAGLGLDQLFEVVSKVRKQTETPLILMGYYNPILALGVDRYVRRAVEAGVNGLIIPDLPPDEASELRAAADKMGLSLIFLVAPTSTPERIALVDQRSIDMVYAVTVAGVTGARRAVSPETVRYLRGLRRSLTKPFVAGFGVSTPSMAARLGALADGVVVGSALVEIIRSKSRQTAATAVRSALRKMRTALDGVK